MFGSLVAWCVMLAPCEGCMWVALYVGRLPGTGRCTRACVLGSVRRAEAEGSQSYRCVVQHKTLWWVVTVASTSSINAASAHV